MFHMSLQFVLGYVFLHISVHISFSRGNFYCKQRDPFSMFSSVFKVIELGISQSTYQIIGDVTSVWLGRQRLDKIIRVLP